MCMLCVCEVMLNGDSQNNGVTCRLQKQLSKHDVILASYDVVRNDIDFFS